MRIVVHNNGFGKPVRPALDAILTALDIITELALMPDRTAEVSTERLRLHLVISKVNIILNSIEKRH